MLDLETMVCKSLILQIQLEIGAAFVRTQEGKVGVHVLGVVMPYFRK